MTEQAKAPSPADAARRILNIDDGVSDEDYVEHLDSVAVATAYLSELGRRERMEEALRKRNIRTIHDTSGYGGRQLLTGYYCVECGSTWGLAKYAEHHGSYCILARAALTEPPKP